MLYSGGFAQPAVLARVADAVKQLETLGASIREVRIPAYEEFDAVSNAMSPELSVCMRALLLEHPAEFGPEDLRWQVAGELVPAVDYIRGQQARRELLRAAYAYEQATEWHRRRPPS